MAFRFSKQGKIRLFLAAVVLLAVIAGSSVWYFSYYTKTPDYSLRMIQSSITKHDMAKFQKYVDLDHLLNTSCDALMDGLIDSERPLSEEARVAVSGFSKMFKVPLVMSFKGIINHYVESGEWSNDASSSVDQGIPIDSDVVLSKSGLKNTTFQKIDYVGVDKDAGIATVGVRVFQQEAGEEFVLEVQMVRTEAGVWRVSEITNFHDFIVFVMKARREHLQEYVDATAAIVEQHDKTVRTADKKILDLLSAGSLGNTTTRQSIKDVMLNEIMPDWVQRKEELTEIDAPASAQSLHRLRLHICDLRIAYAKGYAAWMDDKQAVTIRDANEKLKEAKTLEHEAATLVQQMKAKNN